MSSFFRCPRLQRTHVWNNVSLARKFISFSIWSSLLNCWQFIFQFRCQAICFFPESRAHIWQMIYDFPHIVIDADLRKFRNTLFVLFCFIFLILVVSLKSLQTLLECYLLEVVFCVRHKRYANSKHLSDVYSANVGVRPKVGQVE